MAAICYDYQPTYTTSGTDDTVFAWNERDCGTTSGTFWESQKPVADAYWFSENNPSVEFIELPDRHARTPKGTFVQLEEWVFARAEKVGDLRGSALGAERRCASEGGRRHSRERGIGCRNFRRFA
jgi:hypothetical protein